jgi:hypothetical protein
MKLLDQYVAIHQDPDVFEGYSGAAFFKEIAQLIRSTGTRTVLDYGCGKGRQYATSRWRKMRREIKLAKYDPAVPEFATPHSGPVHGIICTDVLEHVPEEELDGLLSQLAGKAEKWMFFSICCRPSNRFLPDGTNCHVTVKPEKWWLELLKQYRKPGLQIVVRFTA